MNIANITNNITFLKKWKMSRFMYIMIYAGKL